MCTLIINKQQFVNYDCEKLKNILSQKNICAKEIYVPKEYM